MRRLLHLVLGAVLALGAALACGLAPVAQAFPDRPIRLIVPYGTGGITDITARILQPRLGELLGQQIVVDNRPGAAAMIGIGMTARAEADGHTLLGATTALAANPILFRTTPYDARKDFAPIILVGLVPMVLVVPPNSPATTLAELMALGRANPGKMDYGSAGNGSDNHLTAELFGHLAGIRATHVPYRGGGQVMTDQIAGRVSYVFATLPTALPFIGEGRLRALATTGKSRSPALPQVPTVAEQGLPDLVLYAWLGLLAPAGTPAPVLAQLSSAAAATLRHPETAERLRSIGHEIQGGTPQDMGAHLARELNRWAELARHVKFEVSD
jgi:tripartite-type tricarboxylate transporter receptor subunit TctC